jgi:iron complex outermembrane receptor protein
LKKIIMFKKPLIICMLLQLTQVGAQTGAAASALSERDFLAEMPIVLSVSRLAQRLDETPGAMTIFDRNFIRMTGARDLVDVLRLVPGFQSTTSFETDAPMATYHGRTDDFANRIQVLVDGRSVYSGYLQGSAGVGWQTLALDDIERIEVLRGSNSAAYGARAFLGVVNIISRDVRETAGVSAKLTAGENGVADVGTRVGWGDEAAMYRISVDTRGDDGLRKVFSPVDAGKTPNAASGTNRVSRVNFSTHQSSGGLGEIDVRAGAVEIAALRGTKGDGSEGNLERLRFMGSQFLQMDWKMALSDDQDIAVTASHTQGFNNDSFPYLSNAAGASYYGIPIEFKAEEFNDAVSFQHTVRHTQALRTVWGAEVRREQVKSRSSFDTREQVTSQFLRLFGNAEWRVWDAVVVNAGGMAESSDLGGDSFSPRLMVNWHVADGHTLRAGTSTAFRPPSAFEKFGHVKYYDINGNSLTTVKSSGQVVSEKIETKELGYSLNLAGGVSGDLRLFNEQITNGIGTTFNPTGDIGNGDNYTITGTEYQLTWKPASSTLVFFNQTWTNIRVESLAYPNDIPAGKSVSNMWFKIAHGAPKYAASLAAMHTLPSGVNVTFMHQLAEAFAMGLDGGSLYSMGRTDIRVGKTFRVGATKAELALTLQNLEAPYRDGDKKFYFDRRALVSLQFEY